MPKVIKPITIPEKFITESSQFVEKFNSLKSAMDKAEKDMEEHEYLMRKHLKKLLPRKLTTAGTILRAKEANGNIRYYKTAGQVNLGVTKLRLVNTLYKGSYIYWTISCFPCTKGGLCKGRSLTLPYFRFANGDVSVVPIAEVLAARETHEKRFPAEYKALE